MNLKRGEGEMIKMHNIYPCHNMNKILQRIDYQEAGVGPDAAEGLPRLLAPRQLAQSGIHIQYLFWICEILLWKYLLALPVIV